MEGRTMKQNKTYKAELNVTRIIATWIDEHPTTTNVILSTVGAVCALWIFFNV